MNSPSPNLPAASVEVCNYPPVLLRFVRLLPATLSVVIIVRHLKLPELHRPEDRRVRQAAQSRQDCGEALDLDFYSRVKLERILILASPLECWLNCVLSLILAWLRPQHIECAIRSRCLRSRTTSLPLISMALWMMQSRNATS